MTGCRIRHPTSKIWKICIDAVRTSASDLSVFVPALVRRKTKCPFVPPCSPWERSCFNAGTISIQDFAFMLNFVQCSRDHIPVVVILMYEA